MKPETRGIHSSTIQLNVSAFGGIGGAFMGYLRGVRGVLRGVQGVFCFRKGSG